MRNVLQADLDAQGSRADAQHSVTVLLLPTVVINTHQVRGLSCKRAAACTGYEPQQAKSALPDGSWSRLQLLLVIPCANTTAGCNVNNDHVDLSSCCCL